MKYLFTFFIISIVLITGCTKDKQDKCVSLPDSPSPLGYNFKIDSPYLGKPYFNPNNPEEFLYVEYFSVSKLYTYNLNTGEKKLLYVGNILFPPKWSRKNWILLSLSDANIWKIKSNGDSLTQLTFTGSNYYCEWNNEGSKFVFKKVINSLYYSLIADENGLVLDTLGQWIISSYLTWQNPSYLAIVNYSDGILAIDSQFNSSRNIYTVKEEDVDGIYLCNSCTNLIWCSHDKIYSTDIITLKTSVLGSSCLTIYECPSANSNKILVQRIQHKYLGDNIVEVTSKLVLMNMDGSNEQEIPIN